MVVQKYHLQTLEVQACSVTIHQNLPCTPLKMGLCPSILNKETLGQFRGHGEGNNPSWSPEEFLHSRSPEWHSSWKEKSGRLVLAMMTYKQSY